jgi:hypothetical protein
MPWGCLGTCKRSTSRSIRPKPLECDGTGNGSIATSRSTPYRAFVGVLVDCTNAVDAARGDAVVTVLLPEFVTTHWWQQFLHNQPIFLLKTALLYRTGIVISSVPYHLR